MAISDLVGVAASLPVLVRLLHLNELGAMPGSVSEAPAAGGTA